MPDWISWIGYMSIFRYAFEALVVNEVTGSAFNLDVGGYQLDGLDNQLLLDVLGLNKDRFLVNAIVLDAMFVCFLLLAGIILYVILPKHSRRKTWACWLSSLRLGRRSITRQGSVHVPTTSRRAPLAATVASEGTACDLDGASPMAVELSVVQGE